MPVSHVPPAVRRGVRDATPVAVGIIPFGLVTGVASVEAGLSPVQAVGLSFLAFAGASQLAVVDLLGRNAALAVVVLTGVVINLRMLMFSASIAPYFRAFGARWKTLSSYLLTDQAYALAVSWYREEDPDPTARFRYFVAAGGSLWVVWQASLVVGVFAGANVPASWGLEFAVPLVFLGLLVPAVSNRPTLAAAVVGGGVAVAGDVVAVGGGTGLPYNLSLIVGAVAGVLAGVVVSAAGDGDEGNAGSPEEAEH
ncbi:branched-chain amino acid permease (azaleucine resistance) [Halogeometricum pallidum JCM 14848]|uniref:Branched-chain amino acid permease (Azaleucine resistance) n=1 Tax=Halogeometricum pallidum JCM 14848 TaxID=1227487 RepID=M0DEN9_HALPD|nr:AzlC family ABC transporter permease [Halogeometricum pallidum]ELZ33273.1 branched-chain amino acid permease (azaleucine resistance) [Halogeometricum pallidum JCM 14848]